MVLIPVVLAAALVFAIAAVVVGREARRLAAQAPPPGGSTSRTRWRGCAVHVGRRHLPPSSPPDDVRRILHWHLEYFRLKGVSTNGSAAEHRQARWSSAGPRRSTSCSPVPRPWGSSLHPGAGPRRARRPDGLPPDDRRHRSGHRSKGVLDQRASKKCLPVVVVWSHQRKEVVQLRLDCCVGTLEVAVWPMP